jgi:hypothetical protein
MESVTIIQQVFSNPAGGYLVYSRRNSKHPSSPYPIKSNRVHNHSRPEDHLLKKKRRENSRMESVCPCRDFGASWNSNNTESSHTCHLFSYESHQVFSTILASSDLSQMRQEINCKSTDAVAILDMIVSYELMLPLQEIFHLCTCQRCLHNRQRNPFAPSGDSLEQRLLANLSKSVLSPKIFGCHAICF